MDWYGVLFGAVAAWQPGESSIPAYQDSYGQTFHGDGSGKVNQAQRELMLANAELGNAHTNWSSDGLFWLDPWSAEGRAMGAKLLPVASELRIHAENAVVLIAEARTANPNLREGAALDAMDLGARRLDLIGLKWQLSQEIAENYAIVLTRQHDRGHTTVTHNLLDEISSMNGRLQDLRDGYSATKNAYAKVWLGENRPYWLDNVLVRYDLQVQMWQQRGWKFDEVVRAFEDNKELPTADALGLPPAK